MINTIKVNNVIFKGQHADAYEQLMSVRDFTNGSYVATTPYSRFISLLNKANIKYYSYHTTNRINKGYGSLVISIKEV